MKAARVVHPEAHLSSGVSVLQTGVHTSSLAWKRTEFSLHGQRMGLSFWTKSNTTSFFIYPTIVNSQTPYILPLPSCTVFFRSHSCMAFAKRGSKQEDFIKWGRDKASSQLFLMDEWCPHTCSCVLAALQCLPWCMPEPAPKRQAPPSHQSWHQPHSFIKILRYYYSYYLRVTLNLFACNHFSYLLCPSPSVSRRG